MAKKEILVVAEHMNAEDWATDLQRAGYNCHQKGSMLDAVKFLKENQDRPIQLLVQENLRIAFPAPNVEADPDFQALVKHCETKGGAGSLNAYERGVALIQYARQNGLIASTTPAHVASNHDWERYDTLPDGVTGCVSLDPDKGIVSQLAPRHAPAPSGAATGHKR